MKKLIGLAVGAAALMAISGAQAATINWTNWTSFTHDTAPHTGGTATGTIGGVNVNYSGDVFKLNAPPLVFQPASTFSGGTVDDPPSSSDHMIWR